MLGGGSSRGKINAGGETIGTAHIDRLFIVAVRRADDAHTVTLLWRAYMEAVGRLEDQHAKSSECADGQPCFEEELDGTSGC